MRKRSWLDLGAAAAALWFVLLLGTTAPQAGAQQTLVPQAPPPWSGALPPAEGGIALLSTSRDVDTADLVSRLRQEGCDVVTVAISREGGWLVYVPGAPTIVNAAFSASLASTTPFFVRCGGTDRSLALGSGDDGSTTYLQVHQRLRVSLPANPTTGFAWRVEPAVPATVVEQVGEPSFNPSSAALGAGGTMTFELLASGPGLVTLHLIYDRSFEAGSMQDEWAVTVIVRGQQAVAWYGTVADEPAGGHTFALEVLSGEPVAVPIVGSDGQTSNALASFAANGARVLVFGELSCDSSHPDCQVDTVRLVAADSVTTQPAIPVVGWSGTIHAASGEAGNDYFQQAGRFPVQYGIAGATADLEAQLAELRDAGQAVRIWGELQTPRDDVHRTQIVVTEIALAPIP